MPNYFKKIIFISLLLAISGFLYTAKIKAQSNNDAIAIRIFPNPNHYSAKQWYEEKGFSGSPQQTSIDGYDGIRDGRTVYVNVANIDDQGTQIMSDDVLYTNIYLISFSQASRKTTQDIFSQILTNWKFNTNIQVIGQCNTNTTINCNIDADCPSADICNTQSTNQCNLNNTINCDLDADCPRGDFCHSQKAKVIRDVRRLADLKQIEVFLDDYFLENDKYPVIEAGSYVPYQTLSVWPSWKESLADFLNKNIPIDPVNKLGPCSNPRFFAATCWDEDAKEFDGGDPASSLPPGSLVYLYSTEANGKSYTLLGFTESGYIIDSCSGVCGGGQIGNTDNAGANHAPEFLNYNLPVGSTGEEYIGLIRVNDRDGDPITATIDTTPSTWNFWQTDSASANNTPPSLKTTPIPKQFQVYAFRAGEEGDYVFNVTLDDGRGGITTGNFTIKVINPPANITVHDIEYVASTTNPLKFSFIAQDNSVDYGLFYNLSGSPGLPIGHTPSFIRVNPANDYFTFFLNPTNAMFDPATEGPINTEKYYNFSVEVEDFFGAISTENFTITVINNKPIINLPLGCYNRVRHGSMYNTCSISARDNDGHAISYYTINNLPVNIVGTAAGNITGIPADTAIGAHTISVSATDEYGGVSNPRNYILYVDSYCGDGIKNVPNTERRGGPSNNGNEECDGADGIAAGLADSSANRQYECSTPIGDECACTYMVDGSCNPAINCVDECNYIGGWCGDGVTQNGAGNTNLDGSVNNVNYGEACDDGNMITSDLCDTYNGNGNGYCQNTFCGDGITQQPNGAGVGGPFNDGHEDCDGGGCGAGFYCSTNCECLCIPCEFNATDFDYCCFS